MSRERARRFSPAGPQSPNCRQFFLSPADGEPSYAGVPAPTRLQESTHVQNLLDRGIQPAPGMRLPRELLPPHARQFVILRARGGSLRNEPILDFRGPRPSKRKPGGDLSNTFILDFLPVYPGALRISGFHDPAGLNFFTGIPSAFLAVADPGPSGSISRIFCKHSFSFPLSPSVR
jgi:hypothetical protein